ncbi:hypothetical protein ACFQJ7_06660 [Halovenus rubra]|uniref:DUF7124 domain-containing protein n=2 Tax=Halovenus rubra TaxID=869890 RepID=A0ABD5X834_9EURY|nr:hypothetical protein [Halovenus rubra]
MGIAVTGHEDATVTLAVALSALRECTDPKAVIDDAQEWSRHLVIVDRSPMAVKEFAEDHNIDWEFEYDGDKWETMERLRTTTETSRHVFVGVTDGDRSVAMHLDWEYQPLEEAAADADWELKRNASVGGLGERLAELWPF